MRPGIAFGTMLGESEELEEKCIILSERNWEKGGGAEREREREKERGKEKA